MPLTYPNKLTIGVTGCSKFIKRAFFIWDWWGKNFTKSPYCEGLYFLNPFQLKEVPKEEHVELTHKYMKIKYTQWLNINPFYIIYCKTIPKTNVPPYKIEHLTRPFSYFEYILKHTNFRWSLRVDDGCFIKVENLKFLMDSLNHLPDPLYYPVLQGCCFPAYPFYLPHAPKDVRRIVIQGGSGHLTSRYFTDELVKIAPEIIRLQDYGDDWQIADWGLKAGISVMEMGSPYFMSQTKDFWAFPTIVRTKQQITPCKGSLTPTKATCGVNQMVPLHKKVVFHEQDRYVHDMIELMKMDLHGYALIHDYSIWYSFCNWTVWEMEHPEEQLLAE